MVTLDMTHEMIFIKMFMINNIYPTEKEKKV